MAAQGFADDYELRRVFEKFMGKEVPLKPRGNGFTPVDDKDPVLEEMKKEAAAHGATLSLTWPGMASQFEDGKHPERVNVYIVQGKDKKWRVHPFIHRG